MSELASNETGILLIILIIFLIPAILFLITQQNTLKAIQPQNRSMAPGEVWLQLIPLFNLIWMFIVVTRISDSIRKEFHSRAENSLLGLPDPSLVAEMNKRPTYDIGIAYCVLNLCGIVPVIGTFAGLAGLICWIIYWVKLAEYKNKLEKLTY
jgi:hypothetical protein